MGHRVNRDHVVNDSVVVPSTTERAFEAVAVTLEVLGILRHDAEHSSRDSVVAEETTLIVGYHIVNVRPLLHGHGGSDAARRIVGVLRIAEGDCFVSGEFIDSFAVAQVHRDAMIPVRARRIVLAAVRRQQRIADDVISGNVSARPVSRPDQYVQVGLSEDTGGNEFQEFEAAISVIGRVERGQWCGSRFDTPVIRVHGVGDYRAEPLRDRVHIGKHIVVGVVHGDAVAAHRLPHVPAHRCGGHTGRMGTVERAHKPFAEIAE